MAAKESRGLPDSLKQSFNFNKPRPQPQPKDSDTVDSAARSGETEQSGEVLMFPAPAPAHFEETFGQEANTEDKEVKKVITAKTSQYPITSETSAPTTEGVAAGVVAAGGGNKGGRPRGVGKVKKTLYLTTGMEDLKAAQLELAVRARTFIRDESDVVDLALAFLNSQIANPASLEKILTLHNKLKMR